MKPIIVTLLDTPAYGGAEQYVLDCSVVLNKHGHKIIIFTNNQQVKAEYLQYIYRHKIQQFEIHDLPYRLDAIGNWKGLLKFFWHAPKACFWFYITLQQIILKEKKVICLLVGFSDRLLFSAIVKWLKAKLIWVEIGPLTPVFKRNWGFPKLLYEVTKKFPDHQTTTSLSTMKTMIKDGKINKKNITLVYPGIHLFIAKELRILKNSGLQWRKKNCDSDILIGFVGRMATENEVDLLIRASAIAITQSKLKMKLVLVGDGPEKLRFEKLAQQFGIENRVVFTGFVSSNKKFSIMSACDIFVYPRTWSWDGFGIATIEALCVGTPVITTRFGPQKEIIVDSQNGLYFNPKDATNLAKKIVQLAESPTLRKKFSKAGKATVQKKFSYLSMVRSLLRAVNQV